MPQVFWSSRLFVSLRFFLLIVPFFCSKSVAQKVRFEPVTSDTIKERLDKYTGDNKQREKALRQMFVDAGCDRNITEQAVKGSKLPNVICVLPGSTDRVFIVGAHFDRASEGDGVVDNWSGASLLPSLYEALKGEARKHTFIFIGFTDEEKGERGSRFYADQLTKEQISATDGMINMDTLGLGPPEVWATHSDEQLTHLLVYIANQLKVSVTGVNVERVGATTDAESFHDRNIPRITIHSLTQKAWDDRILHSSKDRMSAIRLDDYYQTYRLVAAYLAILDQAALNNSATRSSK